MPENINGINTIISIAGAIFSSIVIFLVKYLIGNLDKTLKEIKDDDKIFKEKIDKFIIEFVEQRTNENNCRVNTQDTFSDLYELIKMNKEEEKNEMISLEHRVEKKVDDLQKDFSSFKKAVTEQINSLKKLIEKNIGKNNG